jgi:hypothetical protein
MKSVQDIIERWRAVLTVKDTLALSSINMPIEEVEALIAYFDDLDSFERLLNNALKDPHGIP